MEKVDLRRGSAGLPKIKKITLSLTLSHIGRGKRSATLSGIAQARLKPRTTFPIEEEGNVVRPFQGRGGGMKRYDPLLNPLPMRERELDLSSPVTVPSLKGSAMRDEITKNENKYLTFKKKSI